MKTTQSSSPKTTAIAFVDLGSNSVRLMIVRINPNRTHTVLTRYKQMVRLGEGAFAAKRLTPKAVRRTMSALRNIAEICAGYETEEVVALATAAVRGADNGLDFVEDAAKQTGIGFEIVSGLEEARLIHLGVKTALPPCDAPTAFIDIGGGSTELTLELPGEAPRYDSLKIGCVRLTNEYPALSSKTRVPRDLYEEACARVRNVSLRSLQKLRDALAGGQIRMVGSSGTVQNLSEIAAALAHASRANRKNAAATADGSSLTLKALSGLARKLCGMTLAERASLPGINPQRADVILGGAAILQTLMEELGANEVTVSYRGLLDGMLQDYLERGRWGYLDDTSSAREQSALRLARSCHFDEAHARRMTNLALGLFDSARSAGLHDYAGHERELLYFAGLLHDIGLFLSFSNHHEHSRYMIENAELLGFHRSEIEIIASAAGMHRKRPSRKAERPSKRCAASLSPGAQRLAETLGIFLRMAESLERSQQQIVTDAALENQGKSLSLRLTLQRESPAELLAIRECASAFKKHFGREFEIVTGQE